MELPIYSLEISEEGDESGVNFVALVDKPAIERNFKTFSKSPQFKFQTKDEEKRILSGPLMIADLPIYRFDEMGEYYAIFQRPTIEKIVHKYFRQGFTQNVNIMHNSDKQVEGVYLFESFIVDRSKGVNPPLGFEDLTDGSWFGSFKVDNEDVWNEFIKSGELKGFSVEGFFDMKPYKKDEFKEVMDYLDALLSNS